MDRADGSAIAAHVNRNCDAFIQVMTAELKLALADDSLWLECRNVADKQVAAGYVFRQSSNFSPGIHS